MSLPEVPEVIAHNQQQRQHEIIVVREVHKFCADLLATVLDHDISKWGPDEYEAFVAARDSLNQSKDGKDPEYQKQLMGPAIRHHVITNPHHPECWDARQREMPLIHAVIMYFDWKSRCIQKDTDMSDFWEYNLAKLKNHPKAKAVVELLRMRDREK